jgi:hypothetical protein
LDLDQALDEDNQRTRVSRSAANMAGHAAYRIELTENGKKQQKWV